MVISLPHRVQRFYYLKLVQAILQISADKDIGAQIFPEFQQPAGWEANNSYRDTYNSIRLVIENKLNDQVEAYVESGAL